MQHQQQHHHQPTHNYNNNYTHHSKQNNNMTGERSIPELIQEFQFRLRDLTYNDAIIINKLTHFSRDNIRASKEISEVIEDRIRKSNNPKSRLAVMFLLDSTMKNIGKVYKDLFTPNIINTYCNCFEISDETIRISLYNLYNSWVRGNTFDNSILDAIKQRCGADEFQRLSILNEKKKQQQQQQQQQQGGAASGGNQNTRNQPPPQTIQQQNNQPPPQPIQQQLVKDPRVNQGSAPNNSFTNTNTPMNNIPPANVNALMNNMMNYMMQQQQQQQQQNNNNFSYLGAFSNPHLFNSLMNGTSNNYNNGNQMQPQQPFEGNVQNNQIIPPPTTNTTNPVTDNAQISQDQEQLSNIIEQLDRFIQAEPNNELQKLLNESRNALYHRPYNHIQYTFFKDQFLSLCQKFKLVAAPIPESKFINNNNNNTGSSIPTYTNLNNSGGINKSNEDTRFDQQSKRDFNPIEIFYTGQPYQCNQCALRFKDSESMRKHMDIHWKQNKKQKKAKKVAMSRSWFPQENEWIDYDHTINSYIPEQPALPFFSTKSKKDQSDKPLPNMVADDSQTHCPICTEKFDKFWDESSEEWMYRGVEISEQLDNKMVHCKCNKADGEDDDDKGFKSSTIKRGIDDLSDNDEDDDEENDGRNIHHHHGDGKFKKQRYTNKKPFSN